MDFIEWNGGEKKDLLVFEKETFLTEETYWGPLLFDMVRRHPSKLLYMRDPATQTVIGYVLYWVWGSIICIAKLGIGLQYRRQGYARRLLQEVMRRAKEVHRSESVVLHVAVENMAAIALYISCGFVTEHVALEYYGSGKHALRLRARIVTEE